MQVAIDFATSQGGEGFIDELPSWLAFFNKYVIAAEVVRASPICIIFGGY